MKFISGTAVCVILIFSAVAAYAQTSETRFAALIVQVSAAGNGYSLQLADIKLIEGICKDEHAGAGEAGENDLLCLILSDKNEVLDSILIKDPLKEHVEYSEDGKNLEWMTRDLTENSFLLRFNYTRDMKKAAFVRVLPGGSTVNAAIFDLDFSSQQ